MYVFEAIEKWLNTMEVYVAFHIIIIMYGKFAIFFFMGFNLVLLKCKGLLRKG